MTCDYSREPVERLLQDCSVLAVISFGSRVGPGDDPRHIYCGLPQLGGPDLSEVWRVSGDVESGSSDGASYSQAEGLIFAACATDEVQDAEAQRRLVHQAYSKLLKLIHARGHTHIVRMWNYLANINLGEGDSERYRQFCAGRQAAFDDCEYEGEMYPSACALGHRESRTIVYLLASTAPVAHVENPNQLAAYRYPRQYGPASPSFARATLANWQTDRQLYVSGTASIVGHQTRCVGDLRGQLRTTFENFDVLLARSALVAETSSEIRMALLKVYVRNVKDYGAVLVAVSERYPGVPAVYLHADICRSDLLVEIDGLCHLPSAQR
jgi:chorismate lyase / 3-hydroxybenzoate synthase